MGTLAPSQRFRTHAGSPDCAREKRRGRPGYAVGWLGMRGNGQGPPQARMLARSLTHPDPHTRTSEAVAPGRRRSSQQLRRHGHCIEGVDVLSHMIGFHRPAHQSPGWQNAASRHTSLEKEVATTTHHAHMPQEITFSPGLAQRPQERRRAPAPSASTKLVEGAFGVWALRQPSPIYISELAWSSAVFDPL